MNRLDMLWSAHKRGLKPEEREQVLLKELRDWRIMTGVLGVVLVLFGLFSIVASAQESHWNDDTIEALGRRVCYEEQAGPFYNVRQYSTYVEVVCGGWEIYLSTGDAS